MPLIPTGLGQRLINRIVDRTRQELGRPVERGKSFYERVKQRVRDEFGVPPTTQEVWEPGPGPEPGMEPEIPPQPPPDSPEEIRDRIRAAGRRLLLLRMKYHGQPRNVEPYSIRDGRGADGTDLFYAWCYKDNALESFRLDRIEDIQITNIPFKPRNDWPVEF